MHRSGVLLGLALPLLGACSSKGSGGETPGPPSPPTPAPAGAPWQTLAEWHLFADAARQEPSPGVVAFDVISVLFADYALKNRFVYVPKGKTIVWSDTERWTFPEGTILVKTFLYPNDARDEQKGRRLLETRLLVNEPEGWTAHTYVYKDSQSDAVYTAAGTTLDVDWIDDQGTTQHEKYNVPNVFDCQSCHGTKPGTHPLGPRTRQLDRDHDYGKGPENQIDHFASLGWFDTTPPATRVHLVDPAGNAPISDRARSYMDANCAHCHSQGGKAESTGFWVGWDMTDPATGEPHHWGSCKFPTSAGPASGSLTYDVVPGKPDESIVVYRVSSTASNVKMPPLLTRLSDDRGVQVLRDWIAAMPPEACQTPP